MIKKALGLAALVLGCANFHTQLPVSWFVLEQDKSVKIHDYGMNVTLKYTAPESGDGEMDDIVSISSFEPFSIIDTMDYNIGGSGKFYASGILFEYRVENDNDGNPSNNVLEFSAQRW